jgi:UDP-N-acetylglucosamine 3-dehydrogenase
MTKLRAVLIGLGAMGKNHARVLSTLDKVELVGAYDLDPVISKEYETLTSIEEAIDVKPDYCVISTPTSSHEKLALRFIENGIAVLIEKPIAMNLQSATQILKKATEFGIKGAVGHVERYNPAIQEAKKLIKRGALGSIYQISTIRHGPKPERVKDVGVTKDLATHDIDTVKYILDSNYQEIFAKSKVVRGSEFEGILLSMGTLLNGVLFVHSVNWESPFKERKISILGEKGNFIIDLLSSTLTFFEHGTSRNIHREIAHYSGSLSTKVSQNSIEKYEPLQREHEEFRNYILNLPNEIVTLQEGCDTLAVAEKMIMHQS